MLLRSIRSRLIGLVLASVVPFIALISVGLWNLWRIDQKAAFERAITEARVVAGQVDDHVGNVRNLMAGLSVAVSWDPKDIDSNDRMLRRVKTELPPYISSIQLFALDGTNIGTSSEVARFNASDRGYFQDIGAGHTLAVGSPIVGRAGKEWIVALARPVTDIDGNLRAVLAVGTRLERFQDALSTAHLPRGSVVRIVDKKLTVIAQSTDGPNLNGSDL
jgi:hypothetical protein